MDVRGSLVPVRNLRALRVRDDTAFGCESVHAHVRAATGRNECVRELMSV